MNNLLEAQVGDLLRASGRKLVTAESCSGGLIGHRLTNIPGSSDYYLGGMIAYAYEAKVAMLGVRWDSLNQFGAVSREVVLEMALGARKVLGVDLAISVSGIAGPGGGLPGKPVGTTWLGLAAADGEWARVFYFAGGREQNKAFAADAALRFVLDYLGGGRELNDTDLTA